MAWKGTPRKDRLRASGVSGWEEQRQAQRILQRDGGRCYLCGAQALEVDHVRPLSKGGTGAEDNLRAICVGCHRRKSRAEAQQARPTIHRAAEPHPGLR